MSNKKKTSQSLEGTSEELQADISRAQSAFQNAEKNQEELLTKQSKRNVAMNRYDTLGIETPKSFDETHPKVSIDELKKAQEKVTTAKRQLSELQRRAESYLQTGGVSHEFMGGSEAAAQVLEEIARSLDFGESPVKPAKM